MKLKRREIQVFSFDFEQVISNERNFEDLILNYISEEILKEYYEHLYTILKGNANIKAGYLYFPDKDVYKSLNKIIINEKVFNVGKIIYRNIKELESIFIITCSIGEEVEKQIWKYFNSGNSLEGYILDKMASELVELSADYLQNLIEKNFFEQQVGISNRYSPGYCGWSVSEQQKLFSLLPENFCGIKLTESSLMIPIKSISGIIAAGKLITKTDYLCEICDDNFCYKKRTE